MPAFTGTGFGRLAEAGGAFQSELLCASSGPLIEKTASPISTLEELATEFRDFIDLDLPKFESGGPRAASLFAPERIDAPTSRAVKDNEKENPAIQQGEFASIHDREKLRF